MATLEIKHEIAIFIFLTFSVQGDMVPVQVPRAELLFPD